MFLLTWLVPPAMDMARTYTRVGGRAQHLAGDLGDVALTLTPDELGQARLRSRLPPVQQPGHGPVAQQLEVLAFQVEAGQALADDGVLGGRSTSAIGRASELEEVGDLLAHAEVKAGHAAALVGQGRHGDPPPLALGPQQRRSGHAHIGEEDLRELRLAGDGDEGASLDPGQAHVDQEA